jgi:hypothetical protein
MGVGRKQEGAKQEGAEDAERRGLSKSGPIVRRGASMKQMAGDLVGSVKGLPADLSTNKKKYLPRLIREQKPYRR